MQRLAELGIEPGQILAVAGGVDRIFPGRGQTVQ